MISSNYYLDEKYNETHHMCDVCSEAITNPICPFCLKAEIEAWLTLYPSLKQELLPKINKYLKKINRKIINDWVECIKCGKKRASICPYCFTEFVFNELQKMNAGKLVLKEFFDFFNFDLGHMGYTKKAEELGAIQ